MMTYFMESCQVLVGFADRFIFFGILHVMKTKLEVKKNKCIIYIYSVFNTYVYPTFAAHISCVVI